METDTTVPFALYLVALLRMIAWFGNGAMKGLFRLAEAQPTKKRTRRRVLVNVGDIRFGFLLGGAEKNTK